MVLEIWIEGNLGNWKGAWKGVSGMLVMFLDLDAGYMGMFSEKTYWHAIAKTGKLPERDYKIKKYSNKKLIELHLWFLHSSWYVIFQWKVQKLSRSPSEEVA